MSRIGRWRPVLAVLIALAFAGGGVATTVVPAASASTASAPVTGAACARPTGSGQAACALATSAPAAGAARSRAATASCGSVGGTPAGYDPAQLQQAYQLPSATSGSGMLVAVVAPYSDAAALGDLCVYRTQFGLAPC